jgi:hypothetical protein
MPTHYWGDEDFDWNSLHRAISEGTHFMEKYGRVGVHSKEKYGTARWSLYLCNGTLHSFTHPGYVYSQYPKWLWCFDLDHNPLKFLQPVINWWQRKVISITFVTLCQKYPHVIDEIIDDLGNGFLPPDLEIRRAKQWNRSCKKCDKWYTTDQNNCPNCGEK